MTTTPKPEPASDKEITALASQHPGLGPKLIARIEVDRATIAKQAEEIERLRSALINLRAKCLEMGWGPEAPQLLDASAALSKPEPGR